MSTSSSASAPFTVRFYDPVTHAPDGEGRTLPEILAFSDRELEYHHDFIQYLFPLPERSPINPQAPVINQATREAFLQRPELRKSLFSAWVRIARFYGFDVEVKDAGSNFENESGGSPARVGVSLHPHPKKFSTNSPLWRTRFSHNHLRITRIIRSLRVLGLTSLARGFHRALLANDAEGKISARTKMFWERAAGRGLHLAPEEENEGARGVAWLRDVEEKAEEEGFDAETGRVAVLAKDEVGEV